MKSLIAALSVFAVIAGQAYAQKPAPEGAPDPVVEYASSDAAMNAARQAAQRSYGQFLAHLRAASPAVQMRDYMVKVGLDAADGGLEHIWVEGLRFDGDRLVGVLGNEPMRLPGMRRGSPVVIEADRVSDWSIATAAGMYGNFTTRVMLSDIDPQMAAQLREVLTPNPLPDDWES